MKEYNIAPAGSVFECDCGWRGARPRPELVSVDVFGGSGQGNWYTAERLIPACPECHSVARPVSNNQLVIRDREVDDHGWLKTLGLAAWAVTGLLFAGAVMVMLARAILGNIPG